MMLQARRYVAPDPPDRTRRRLRSARTTVVPRLAAVAAAAFALVLVPASASAPSERYLVLYKQQGALPATVVRDVERAGGAVVAQYPQIGVVVARSSSAGFGAAMARDARVEGAASTAAFAIRLEHAPDAGEEQLPNAPATDGDTFSARQWDMRQISAPEAHAVTGGSNAVVVGNIDTGLDKDHPDLVSNIDFAKSASCESGAPNTDPAAWDDRHGHGTHTAGTIAADDNGAGIVGVAPNVRVAGIKASTDEGYFFPEMVVCAFMWAGSQHLDVTNNSYYADPYLYNCRNDPAQRAIWKAEMRAIRYAQQQGVTVVASEGNSSDDLSHPTYDDSSPDYPPDTAEERRITNACVVVPNEVPGVIGVTAVGNRRQTDGDDDPDDYLKSYYSSYGVSTADITAPGGDAVFGITAEAPNGRVLSTWPKELPCARREIQPAESPLGGSTYCYAQGTSMAGPHVAGVAALIVSRFGDLQTPQNGKMRPQQVESHLQQTADAQPCPTALPLGYAGFTRPDGSPQDCQGGPGHTAWYGAGQVNALRAVLHDTNGSP